MTYYLYFSHADYYYITIRKLSEEETYCDSCKDSDELIGAFRNKSELTKLLKADISRIVKE